MTVLTKSNFSDSRHSKITNFYLQNYPFYKDFEQKFFKKISKRLFLLLFRKTAIFAHFIPSHNEDTLALASSDFNSFTVFKKVLTFYPNSFYCR